MKRILIALFSAWVTLANAQLDTITQAEREILHSGFSSSSIAYYNKARSNSLRGDSTTASANFLKVHPYYLLWEWRNTDRPDTFLSKFTISPEARKNSLESYHKARKETKSATYITFEKMAEEDQNVRDRLDKCGDSISCSILSRKMRTTDSAHFEYLYNYVVKNGWPSLVDGSMNATLLAIHDHERHSFYMPYLKKAVIAGIADITALELINHFLTESSSSKTELRNADIQKANYRFDITAVMKGGTPASLSRIQKAIKDVCGKNFKIYYVYECAGTEESKNWGIKQLHKSHGLEKMQEQLKPACSKSRYYFSTDVWHISFMPSLKTRLMMYIVVKSATH